MLTLPCSKIDSNLIVDKLSKEICEGMEISKIKSLAAESAASHSIRHPDYSRLAGRIELSHLYKHTGAKFSSVVTLLRHNEDPITKESAPLISEEVYNLAVKWADVLDNAIQHCNDDLFDYFAIKTLQKTYLRKINDVIVERPQHMFMRVALGIHMEDMEGVLETYGMLSRQYYIHATPTLVNAGSCSPQLSSCFLAPMKSDSVDGIYDTLKNCAIISKHGGGIGLSISNVRASGSYVCDSHTSSGQGIVPLLRLFNNSSRYTSEVRPVESMCICVLLQTNDCRLAQTSSRKTGVAVYIEPWHADVFDFLDLRKNHGNENERTRDIYTGMWVPNLFMERVVGDDNWTLMCPRECPGLDSLWGTEFDCLYTRYEREGRGKRKIKARELWFAILHSQTETGTPYILYKDHCNKKSNQNNLGTIKCSNLCTEIVQFSSNEEVAVCNLASINIKQFVDRDITGGFNFDELRKVSGVVTRNLNLVIDRTRYPLVEAASSNKRHRPIGIGVQGLADVFQIMGFPYNSSDARQL
jgi:ribonucleotide reductase alpha subunit